MKPDQTAYQALLVKRVPPKYQPSSVRQALTGKIKDTQPKAMVADSQASTDSSGSDNPDNHFSGPCFGSTGQEAIKTKF